jgi:chromosomal replication initiation ATPase DnaA
MEIGQRYGRRHSAVAMAVRAIEADARTNAELAERLSKLALMLQRSDK